MDPDLCGISYTLLCNYNMQFFDLMMHLEVIVCACLASGALYYAVYKYVKQAAELKESNRKLNQANQMISQLTAQTIAQGDQAVSR